MTARAVQEHLRSLGSPEAAASAARYYKTGPGQYAEGDIFLGLCAVVMSRLAKEYRDLSFNELQVLIRSAVHEDRSLALLVLVLRVSKSDEATKKMERFAIDGRRLVAPLPRCPARAMDPLLGWRRLTVK
jgi:hypothetical protein